MTLRACRYPHRVRPGSNCPAACSSPTRSPGRTSGRRPRRSAWPRRRTILKGEDGRAGGADDRLPGGGAGPEEGPLAPAVHDQRRPSRRRCWSDFRQRQHHEQAYRVGVHDEFLDAVPCGYDKDSPDRQRPRFHRGPLQMIGWLVALVYNAVGDLAVQLAERYHGAHVRDAAADVLQPSGPAVLDAGGADRLPGPVPRAGGLGAGDRCAQCPATSHPLVGESPPGPVAILRLDPDAGRRPVGFHCLQ